MTNEEMKRALANGGVSTAEIENVSDRFDAEKITEIVEAASTPKEAMEALNAFYPELEVEALQKQCDFVMEQVEAAMKGQENAEPMELTEEELDMVSGGGIGDWFKKNWKKVAIGAAIVVGAALICTGVGAGIGACITGSLICGTMTASGAIVGVYGTMAATGAPIGAGVGAAAGGAVVGGLAGTDNLPG